MDKRTPLYEKHLKLGGKMVSFAGFEMPVQYPAGVIKEHLAVRDSVGVFDVSHMGELMITGPDALKELNRIMTNDFSDMEIGRIRYTVMCNESGGCVDDLIVYKIGEEKYLLVVNASNTNKDREWINEHLTGDVSLEDLSDDMAQIAVQGPKSKELLERLMDSGLAAAHENPESGALPDKYYWFTDHVNLVGVDCLVSRTGYTGSFGYEIYMAKNRAETVWDALLSQGEDLGILPCGLGARDTLRLEAGMPLYGHEMNDDISPLEADLGFGVKMSKADFVGKSGIEKRCKDGASGQGPNRIRVGIKVTGRGIAREHSEIFFPGSNKKIGEVTSGTHAPYLGYPIAMALLDREFSAPGDEVEIDVRGKRVAAEITLLPFYKQ